MADIKTMWLPGASGPQNLADVEAREQLKNKLDATDLPEAINTALAQAKESGEFDGAPGTPGYTPVKDKDYFDGKDGVSPTVAVSDITGGHRISITDKNGTKTVDVMDGAKGDAGRGITSVARTSGNGTAGTTDTYTITYTDGSKSTFTVNNGKDGSAGTNGQRGTGVLKVTTAPASYTTATGGKNPIKRMSISTIKSQAHVDEVLVGDQIAYSYYHYHVYYLDATYAYMDTYQSIRGAAGSDATVTAANIQSALGYVPADAGNVVRAQQGSANVGKILVVGADGNLTLTDMPELLSGDVIGTLDENNNIVITGSLNDGTYTFVYENADGTYADIGRLVIGSGDDGPTYTNLIDTVGYTNDIRLSTSDGVSTRDAVGYVTTGLIDLSSYDGSGQETIVRTKGVIFNYSSYSNCQFYAYSADGSFITAYTLDGTDRNGVTFTIDDEFNLTLTYPASGATSMRYFRLTGYGDGANLIVTVNEEITD